MATTMTGLLAMAAVGIGPAADPCDETISVQVRVLDMDGLGWRSDAYARLRPVATRGTSTVWTADRALGEELAARSQNVVSAPRVSAVGEASVSHKKTIHYVASVDRVANGPINGASSLAYRPEVGKFEAGTEARVSGRKLDQGVLAQVALADSRVLAMHKVKVGETVAPARPIAPAPKPANVVAGDYVKMAFELAFGAPPAPRRRDLGMATTFQVPEVARTEIEGEWLIPTDGILVVSLGVDTVADEQGRAVARERLAVLEVLPDAQPMPIAVSHLNTKFAPVPEPDAVVAASYEAAPVLPVLPTPSAPGRSLPLPIDGDGNVVDLPPLPIAVSTVDHAIRPAANQPSPQTVNLSTVDPAVAQASFAAPAPGVTTSVVSTAGPTIGLGLQMKDGRGTPVQEVEKDLTDALKAPGKTETVRVPLGGNLSLEIKATVVPAAPAERDVATRPVDRR